jgi:spore maturation protein SpmA
VLNYIWLALVLLAVVLGGSTGRMEAVSEGAFSAAQAAATLALGLIGIMALWLGVMRLAERAGLVQLLARVLQPVMRRLFPDVPRDHPANGAMVMNMAANMLGLGNAATPLGLRAMEHLERLNPHPGTATNAMCTFLAINTSSIQLIPATTVAILSSAGSMRPSAIIGTAFMATICSTVVGITAVKLLEKMPGFRETSAKKAAPTEKEAEPNKEDEAEVFVEPPRVLGLGGRVILTGFILFFVALLGLLTFSPKLLDSTTPGPGEARITIKKTERVAGLIQSDTGSAITVQLPGGDVRSIPKADDVKIERYDSAMVRLVNAISILAVPFLLSLFPLYAALRGLKVYEEFVEGAKEGFQVAVRIIPYLVTMLVAIGMFRGSGGIDLLTAALRPVLNLVGFPPELMPLALMRPLSGSGSNALFVDLIKTFGPDHLLTYTAGTIIGSTETTFYVAAIYFGAVAVKRMRHAIPAGLLADLAGIIAAIIICRAVLA